MDSITEHSDFGYLNDHPVLIVASSDAASARARRSIEAAGFRIGQAMDVGQACERIQLQPAASAIWVELDRDCGPDMDRVLDSVANSASEERFAAIVSATAALLDPISARVKDSVDVIVDADDSERASALALVRARAAVPVGISDVASDRSTERLRQLSDEVSRIAATLARLSSNPPMNSARADAPRVGAVPAVSAERVRAVIRARRLRSRYFAEHLFADPAWDMMLDLLQAEIAQLRVPVSSLCIAAAVPATTALRWLKTLVHEGVFLRRADPHDGRRDFVELAPGASEALRRYFSEIDDAVVI
jgi:DNA-binding MarR family transcriptional regulator